MKVFISYSKDDRATADALEVGLRQEGHDVFFDKTGLPAGESFHARIRGEIAAADAFVFIISPSSVRPESYAMTELGFARKRWPDPSGRVIPVLARPTEMEQIPPYVAAVTFVQGGNIVAETIGWVARIDAERRRQARNRLQMRVGAAAGAAILVAAGWKMVSAWRTVPVDPQPCYLSARVAQRIGLSGYLLDTVYEGESNSFLSNDAGVASIHVGPLRSGDAEWSFAVRSATGEMLARHELRGCPETPLSFTLNEDVDVTLTPR